MEYNIDNLNIDYLAFANEEVLHAPNQKTEQTQVLKFEEQAAKVGFHIAYEKMKFVTNIKLTPKTLQITKDK